MMKDTLSCLTKTSREWAYSIAGGPISDEEVLTLITEYEDWILTHEGEK